MSKCILCRNFLKQCLQDMEILEDHNWISKQKTLCLPNGWVSLLYSKWIPLAIFFLLDQIILH